MIPEKIEGRGSQKGWSFEQIKRTDMVAFYKKTNQNLVYYEVFKIPHKRERKFGDRVIPAGEYYPGDNGFGKIEFQAICTASLERAEEYYNELLKQMHAASQARKLIKS